MEAGYNFPLQLNMKLRITTVWVEKAYHIFGWKYDLITWRFVYDIFNHNWGSCEAITKTKVTEET